MTSVVQGAFLAALAGKNDRVVQIPHPSGTFLAQNADGHAALVARVSLRPDQVAPDGRGFAVRTSRAGDNHFVKIISPDPGLSLLFIKLVDYILERTAGAESEEDVATLLVAALDEFKRFSQKRQGRLSEEEIRGLVAELLFLLQLHGDDESKTWDVFHAWGGPFGSLHDFEFAHGNAVEVKSTHRPPSEVRIASPAQLRPVPDGLDLVVLPLERVAPGHGAEIGFLDLIAKVDKIARAAGGDVSELWDAVVGGLELDLEDEYYRQWQFVRGEWLRFVVNDQFPRILESDIPPGVIRVAFSLQLQSLTAFAADFSELEGAV